MRRSTFKACAAALALAALSPVARADDRPLSPDLPVTLPRLVGAQQLESDLLAAINALRAARGMRPLRQAPGLRQAARAHSGAMAQHGFFDHASKGGRAYWRRIERYYPSRGFRHWAVGENIVYGSPILSAREALREWLASPPHRAVLLDRTWRDAGIGAAYTSTGQGVFEGLPTTVVTLDVGARRR